MFLWCAYLGRHPQAEEIFSSPVTSFYADAFPKKDPNSKKLVGNCGLRVDFVCVRADRSAVRLHPGQSREATVVVERVEDWRLGRRPVHAIDDQAMKTRTGAKK